MLRGRRMDKFLLVILTAGLLGVGGWRGYGYYQSTHAKPVAKAPAASGSAKGSAQPAVVDAKRQADIDATRKDIEAQLKPLKVTSIMPGEPGIAIINKKEYAEGDKLTLSGGKKQLQVAKVNEDGILLAYSGLTFRLDLPAAPDLEALRKK